MPSDDQEVMRAIDQAVSHLLYARFGHLSPSARRGVYRRAANLFLEVVVMLQLREKEEDELEKAERMMDRERWSP